MYNTGLIMPDRRYRVLFIATHAAQYASPLYRQMARDPRLEIQVAYCTLQGATSGGVDPDFGREVKWDVPLLDGYPWTQVPNRASRPGLGRFFGLINSGLWSMIRKGCFDAVVIYTGYRYASFWIALAAAKLSGSKLFFGTDAASIAARSGDPSRVRAKKIVWPWLFRLADQIIVPSSAARDAICSLGFSPDRVVLTPYAVDNNWWLARAAEVNRAEVRTSWGVPESSVIILFCAKLQPWKRPQDLLTAFARANVASAHLVFAGDGPMSTDLEAQAAQLGLRDRVHFLGFVNQSQLPAVYCASDLFVLPSDYEPFGVVVNEAMLCARAVAVSDRVGAGRDLVSPETGFVFPVGDVDALAAVLREANSNPQKLSRIGEAGRKRMESWSLRENVDALVQALDRAVPSRGKAAAA
jgi:glycosyltransferase involved in cell wall biosynthesis